MTAESRRSLAGRIAANERWAKCPDRKAALAPARKAFDDRWDRLVDPNNELPVAERTRRAESAKRAHFQRLALASAKSRARKAAQQPRGRKAA